jgi:hypothetical protein
VFAPQLLVVVLVLVVVTLGCKFGITFAKLLIALAFELVILVTALAKAPDTLAMLPDPVLATLTIPAIPVLATVVVEVNPIPATLAVVAKPVLAIAVAAVNPVVAIELAVVNPAAFILVNAELVLIATLA